MDLYTPGTDFTERSPRRKDVVQVVEDATRTDFRLTSKQAEFVHQYKLNGGDGAKAAVAAGYARDGQHLRLLANEHIKAAIGLYSPDRGVLDTVTQEYVVQRIVDVVERCMEARPVLNAKGEIICNDQGQAVFKFDSSGANTALKMLAQLKGMFPKHQGASEPEGGDTYIQVNNQQINVGTPEVKDFITSLRHGGNAISGQLEGGTPEVSTSPSP